jgi:hypothetical protein
LFSLQTRYGGSIRWVAASYIAINRVPADDIFRYSDPLQYPVRAGIAQKNRRTFFHVWWQRS